MNWRGLLFGLICAAWLLFTPMAIFLAFMSPFLSAGGTSPGVWMLMVNFFTWPIATVLAPIAAAILYKRGRRRAAWLLAGAPLLWSVVPLLVWGYILPQRLSS